MKFLIWLHRKLNRCQYCHWRKADWDYAPGYEQACDICVPRGCSCNLEPKNGYPKTAQEYDLLTKDDFYEPVDELGRKYPCCEWWNVKEFDKK